MERGREHPPAFTACPVPRTAGGLLTPRCRCRDHLPNVRRRARGLHVHCHCVHLADLAWIRPLRILRTRTHGQLVDGSQRGPIAYYHCRPGCRAVNVIKEKLEGLFADELACCSRRQATCGYSRSPCSRSGRARKAAVRDELAIAEHSFPRESRSKETALFEPP